MLNTGKETTIGIGKTWHIPFLAFSISICLEFLWQDLTHVELMNLLKFQKSNIRKNFVQGGSNWLHFILLLDKTRHLKEAVTQMNLTEWTQLIKHGLKMHYIKDWISPDKCICACMLHHKMVELALTHKCSISQRMMKHSPILSIHLSGPTL